MFDSPFDHCPVCGQMVVLDQTRSECVADHQCAPGTACPLQKYFTGGDPVPAQEEPRDKTAERRNFWRAVFHSPVQLTTGDRQVEARLLDISLKGALLETGIPWHGGAGEECRLNLELAPGTTIAMQCTAIHVEGSHVGLRCASIDLDSITHLRRLVELNSGDPATLEREVGSLIREG